MVSAYGDALPEERWLLFVAHDNAQVAAELMHLWTTQHCCLLCQRCLEPLSRVKPALPPRARCNDMWGGRLPEPIRVLTYAETKVLQLARACVSMKRAGKPENLRNSFLRRSAHWVSSGKNIVAYPQRPHTFVSACIILTPDKVCETLCVQFVGADRAVVREDPSLKVSVSRCVVRSNGLLRTTLFGGRGSATIVVVELLCRPASRRLGNVSGGWKRLI